MIYITQLIIAPTETLPHEIHLVSFDSEDDWETFKNDDTNKIRFSVEIAEVIPSELTTHLRYKLERK